MHIHKWINYEKNDFVYIRNPESGKPFVIISYGADGQEGGEGYDRDIESTNLEGTESDSTYSDEGPYEGE